MDWSPYPTSNVSLQKVSSAHAQSQSKFNALNVCYDLSSSTRVKRSFKITVYDSDLDDSTSQIHRGSHPHHGT